MDRKILFDSFLERLKKDKEKNHISPDYIIISGDLAFSGLKHEYASAEYLLDHLLIALGLERDRIFIVPGNHDVNRGKYRPQDIPLYNDMQELNLELENNRYRNDLLKGLEEYFEFIAHYCPHLKPVADNLVPFVNTCESQLGKIAFVGVNSAWMCRKSPDREEIAIGEYQMKRAQAEVKKDPDIQLIIHIFHHPLQWLWPRDRKNAEMWFDNSICLTGHLHDEEGLYLNAREGQLYQFQAGGFYPGYNHGLPARYQYITIKQEEIRLDFRIFSGEDQRWVIDSTRGDDGKKVFAHTLISITGTEESPSLGWNLRSKYTVFEKYLHYAYNQHSHLPTRGFETSLRLPIQIDQVYVRLSLARFFFSSRQDILPGNAPAKAEKEDLNLEAVFALIREPGPKDLVILGDPGSGKSTLLKYITMKLIEGKGAETFGLNSQLIPFLLRLRELKNPGAEKLAEFIFRVCYFDELGIGIAALENLLNQGLGIILLDGLDEVTDNTLRREVLHWIEKSRRIYHKTRFIITSRFAVYTGNDRLEGNLIEFTINRFTAADTAAFIKNWYRAVEAALHPGEYSAVQDAEREAERFISSITNSAGLQQLITNPLLLQITALVHRDRGHLPERRVELYEECVDILLGKWDMAKGLDVMLHAKDARQILQHLALWLQSKEGVYAVPSEELLEVIKEPLALLDKSDLDPQSLLTHLRDRSGILTSYRGNEYGFIHLSFQEHLAAEEIRNKDLVDLLVTNYANPWWREVILLSLSLENPSILDRFIEKIICTKAFLTDISLVQEAVRDARMKPVATLILCLEKPELPEAAKRSIKTILTELAENGHEAAKAVLQQTTDIGQKRFSPISNPYRSGNLIQELQQGSTAMFYGRRETIKDLKQILVHDNEGLVFIYGQRRAGKSCLMKYMEATDQLSPDLAAVLIDIQGISSEREFYSTVLEKTGEFIKTENRVPMKPDSYAAFNDALRTLAAAARIPILLMLDEYEHITKDSFRYESCAHAGDFTGKIRSTIQHTPGIKFAIAGTEGLKNMVNDYNHPFFKAGRIFHIGALGTQDALDLITEPLKGKVTYTSQAVQKILTATFSHPFYIQLLCQTIINILNQKRISVVSAEQVQQAMDYIDKQEPDIFEYVWEITDQDAHLVLAIIAEKMGIQSWIPVEMIEKIIRENQFPLSNDIINGPLKSLVEKQFVHENSDMEYTIPIGLLYFWIKRHKSLKRVRREFR